MSPSKAKELEDKKYKFVVAINLEEAKALLSRTGHDTIEKAQDHLERVKKPPTDPFYGNRYKIFKLLAS